MARYAIQRESPAPADPETLPRYTLCESRICDEHPALTLGELLELLLAPRPAGAMEIPIETLQIIDDNVYLTYFNDDESQIVATILPADLVDQPLSEEEQERLALDACDGEDGKSVMGAHEDETITRLLIRGLYGHCDLIEYPNAAPGENVYGRADNEHGTWRGVTERGLKVAREILAQRRAARPVLRCEQLGPETISAWQSSTTTTTAPPSPNSPRSSAGPRTRFAKPSTTPANQPTSNDAPQLIQGELPTCQIGTE